VHADPNALDMDVPQGDSLNAGNTLLECSSRPIGMTQAACSQGLAEIGMRMQDPTA
jgi:hypothetical protein